MISKYTLPEYVVPSRQFQIFEFMITHCQLLLCSNRYPEAGYSNRIELLFSGVEFMSIPPRFRNLHLRRASEPERDRLLAPTGFTPSAEVDLYLLHPEKPWFVASGPPQWTEADRAYDEPSAFFPEEWGMEPDITIGSLTYMRATG